jgi:hypothetical protein
MQLLALMVPERYNRFMHASNKAGPSAPSSLLEGVEEATCVALGIARLRHKSALLSLRIPGGLDLARTVYDKVASNWGASHAAANKDRSRENWRWSLQTYISPANRSPEVMLERAIAKACVDDAWANQIPVASGLVTGANDGRRAIDLVQRRGEGHYELIELKIASDTPLYAAVELLGYACLWLLAREDPPVTQPEFLDAKRLDLRVLAPAAYYAPYQLGQVERSIATGVRSLGRGAGVDMTFEFDVLPDDLTRVPLPSGEALLLALAERRPLHR